MKSLSLFIVMGMGMENDSRIGAQGRTIVMKLDQARRALFLSAYAHTDSSLGNQSGRCDCG